MREEILRVFWRRSLTFLHSDTYQNVYADSEHWYEPTVRWPKYLWTVYVLIKSNKGVVIKTCDPVKSQIWNTD